MKTALLAAACLAMGCGGIADANDGGQDASSDMTVSDGPDAGFTACSGPSGQQLCGGACGAACPPIACASSSGFPIPDATAPDAALGVCFTSKGAHGGRCTMCQDGWLCVPETLGLPLYNPDPIKEFDYLSEAELGYAILYALNGHGGDVRYADRAQYNGEAIPEEPSGCPTQNDFRVCGGACGDCDTGFKCTGRSPLHPYSLCVNDFQGQPNKPQPDDGCLRGTPNGGGCNDLPQDPPLACLTFKVSDADQPVADAHGICVDATLCAGAAQSYPGGVYCTN